MQAVAREIAPLQLLDGLNDPEPVHGAVAVAALHPLVGTQSGLECRVAPILSQQLRGRVPDLSIEHGYPRSRRVGARPDNHPVLNNDPRRRFQTQGLHGSF
jgi:hypothetical protein